MPHVHRGRRLEAGDRQVDGEKVACDKGGKKPGVPGRRPGGASPTAIGRTDGTPGRRRAAQGCRLYIAAGDRRRGNRAPPQPKIEGALQLHPDFVPKLSPSPLAPLPGKDMLEGSWPTIVPSAKAVP